MLIRIGLVLAMLLPAQALAASTLGAKRSSR
jgi:hypothetical protein